MLDGHGDAGRGSVRELVVDLPRVPGLRAEQRLLDLLHEASAAELDDGVRLRLPRRADEVDDEGVALPGAAVVGGDELRDRLA